jgi:hypothetical protein
VSHGVLRCAGCGEPVPLACDALSPRADAYKCECGVITSLKTGEAFGVPKIDWKNIKKQRVGDAVNHPSHYTSGGIEAIAVIEAWGLGFHLGNAVKYISRAGKKDPAKTLEDLQKARWYLDREIARLAPTSHGK